MAYISYASATLRPTNNSHAVRPYSAGWLKRNRGPVLGSLRCATPGHASQGLHGRPSNELVSSGVTQRRRHRDVRQAGAQVMAACAPLQHAAAEVWPASNTTGFWSALGRSPATSPREARSRQRDGEPNGPNEDSRTQGWGTSRSRATSLSHPSRTARPGVRAATHSAGERRQGPRQPPKHRTKRSVGPMANRFRDGSPRQ